MLYECTEHETYLAKIQMNVYTGSTKFSIKLISNQNENERTIIIIK